jgi:hypothetical protein
LNLGNRSLCDTFQAALAKAAMNGLGMNGLGGYWPRQTTIALQHWSSSTIELPARLSSSPQATY